MGHEDFYIDDLRFIALPDKAGAYTFYVIYDDKTIAAMDVRDAKRLATWLTTDKSQEEIE